MRWLTVIAAAAVLLAVVVPSRLNRSQAPSLDVAVEHFEAERGPYRTFEARLSGDSTYRAMQPRSRSVAEPSAGSDVERLRQAAQDLEAAADGAGDRSASRSALATMHLQLGNVRAAVELLEPLAASADARGLSDLGAAYLARRVDDDGRRALEVLERAVVLDAAYAPAWFNLALAAEAEGRTARAIEAWNRMLQLDTASGWADEARAHLQILNNR